MTNKNNADWGPDLREKLFQTLARCIPPKEYSPHLQDLVNALTDALSRGEISINLDSNSSDHKITAKDWPQSHIHALTKSGWLDGDSSPMILIGNELSWRRWYEEMNSVTNELLTRSKATNQNSSPKKLSTHYSHIKGLNQEQETAVKALDDHRVVLISGGPGTGKTSTITMLLERALTFEPEIRVGLSAPTGKAARRLQESLLKNSQNPNLDKGQQIAALPCNTLHRWLKASHGEFGHNKQNQLPIDLIVVDEMSMVDLTLMKALLNALPYTCKLVLVGDADQLPPVGLGAIWRELQQEHIKNKFGTSAVHLHQLYRNRGDLAVLSKILRDHGPCEFWKQLSVLPQSSNLQKHCHKTKAIPQSLKIHMTTHLKRLALLTKQLMSSHFEDVNELNNQNSDFILSAEKLLSQLNNLMVLCPMRRGQWGIDDVHKSLLGPNFQEDIASWPEGTPVICGENQPELGLSNGDIGLIIGQGNNLRLLFQVVSEENDNQIRLIHPARLKLLQPALALTVHKSQGSEAKHVILLWPDEILKSDQTDQLRKQSQEYSAKLLYTAITRATEKVDILTTSDGNNLFY